MSYAISIIFLENPVILAICLIDKPSISLSLLLISFLFAFSKTCILGANTPVPLPGLRLVFIGTVH